MWHLIDSPRKTTVLATVAVLLSALPVVGATATNINVQLVRATNFFMGSTMDPVTGKFYTRDNLGLEDNGLARVYDSAADYQDDVSSGSVQLGGDGFWGTYFAVRDGKFYGRAGVVKASFPSMPWPIDSSVARWDAVTGERELDVASIPNMGGINGDHTFDWGGFSAVNWMQDASDLYVMGKNLTGNVWQVNRMDADLNILETVTFSANRLGYAFVIGGHLFTGDSFNSSHMSNEIDLSTGTHTTVDINLIGLVGDTYMSNTFYDPNADTLYLFSAGSIYKVTNASDRVQNPPQEQIEALIQDVQELALHGMAGQAQLNAALDALAQDPPDIQGAIDALQAFINFVNAQSGKKIPAPQAEDFIAAAQAIIDSLSQ